MTVGRFEYRIFHEEVHTVTIDGDDDVQRWLNARGAEGWEFISLRWSVREDFVFGKDGNQADWKAAIHAVGKRQRD